VGEDPTGDRQLGRGILADQQVAPTLLRWPP
jgi:hypothetical protein